LAWQQAVTLCVEAEATSELDVGFRSGRRFSVSCQVIPGPAPAQDSIQHSLQQHKSTQLIILNETTQLRQLQLQANRNDRLRELGDMAAMLSHQLKTPLATGQLYLDQLKRQISEVSEPAQRSIERVSQQLAYMNRQVNHCLFFTRGELPVNAIVSLEQLCQQLRTLATGIVDAHRFEVHCPPALDEHVLPCHLDSVLGALTNLLKNAAEASPQGAKIELILQKYTCQDLKQTSRVVFDVLDQGPGFSSTALNGMASNFTSKQNGNGLGLNYVAVVAQKHGGDFAVLPHGKQTCVRLSLPGEL